MKSSRRQVPHLWHRNWRPTDTQTLDRNWYIPSRSTCLGISSQKRTFRIHLEMMCLQKWTILVPPQVWKKWQYWPVSIYLFAILKTQKKHHQPSTLWLDVLFRLIRSPLFRVAKTRRTHRNKSNENAGSFKREQHEKNLLTYLLPCLVASLLTYSLASLLTYILHHFLPFHGSSPWSFKTKLSHSRLGHGWVGLSPPSCRWIVNA